MKISNINYSDKNNKSVLSAQIILGSGKTYNLFFEVSKPFKDYIVNDASPFLAAVLPLAMYKKEQLEIDGSVSKKLMHNASEIMKILESWNEGFSPVKIEPGQEEQDEDRLKNIGCFFSGGVDSFYTYIKNNRKINDLIFVHGFDINANNYDLYGKIEKNIIKIARKEKKKLIRVRTNIREIFDEYFGWDLYHTFAIASVALFLRAGFKEIYLSCGLPNKNGDHNFLTPELDLLWRTETIKLNHYGCDADKITKLKFLSDYDLAMKNLRVCWVNKKREYNCCECEKCFRNMLGLYIFGSLQACKTFNKKIDADKLRNVRVDQYCLKYFKAVFKVMKFKNIQSEIRFALEDCIKNNTHPKLQVKLYQYCRDSIRFLDQNYNRNRLYWYLSSRGLIK